MPVPAGPAWAWRLWRLPALTWNRTFSERTTRLKLKNVNELLFDGAKHSYAKFIDGVLIAEERVCLEVYETIWWQSFRLWSWATTARLYGTISGIKNKKGVRCVVWIDAHDIHTPPQHLPATCTEQPLAMATGIDNLESVNDPKGETPEYWEQLKRRCSGS